MRQLADYQSHIEEFGKENVDVVALSVDSLDKAKETVDKLQLTFPVAYGLEVPRDADRIGAVEGFPFVQREVAVRPSAGSASALSTAASTSMPTVVTPPPLPPGGGAVTGAPRVLVTPPEGGMFVMLDVRETGLGSDAFARGLLKAESVAVLPCARGHG